MENAVSFGFRVSGLSVLPFWLLMWLRPRARFTRRVMASPFVVLGPLLLYAALVLPRLGTLLPLVARPELARIAPLLGMPLGATIAWAHFLALDLFAGRWIFLDAREREISPWVVSPILLLTLLFAPLGLAAYLVVGRLDGRALAGQVRRAGRWLVGAHRPLAYTTLGCVGLLVATGVLGAFDHRQLAGAPLWLKPAKFALSVGLAAPALAWILDQMRGPRWARLHLAGTIFAAVGAFELAIIALQAARGVRSHFNVATPLDGTLFTIMGLSITMLWLAEAYVTVAAFRQRFATPVRTWGIRLGLVGTLAGGAVGFAMPHPTPDQLASLRAGRPTPVVGAHTVGAPDGGPSLPITRWSTVGGDLRVPHFFGLHALQVLPFLAWLLERRRRFAARPIVAFAIGWLGLTLVVLAQALRGEPLVHPGLASVVAASAAIAAAIGVAFLGRSGALSRSAALARSV